MVMAYFFGVASPSTWESIRPHSRRLLRAGVLCMALATGCHIWDQYDARSDQPVLAQIVDCTVVSTLEQPLLRITVDQKTYLLRPKPGILNTSTCRPGEQIKLYHPPGEPTNLRRLRQSILSEPALLASALGFLLIFIALYLYIWPIWVSGNWDTAPARVRWLRRVPVQWLSLALLPLAYPFVRWMRS